MKTPYEYLKAIIVTFDLNLLRFILLISLSIAAILVYLFFKERRWMEKGFLLIFFALCLSLLTIIFLKLLFSFYVIKFDFVNF